LLGIESVRGIIAYYWREK